MPSPTDKTVPTSATSIAFSYPASSCFKISVISSGLISISTPRGLTRQLPKALDRAPDRSIEEPAPDPRDKAAQNLGIDRGAQTHGLSHGPRQRFGQRGLFGRSRRGSKRHERFDDAPLAIPVSTNHRQN